MVSVGLGKLLESWPEEVAVLSLVDILRESGLITEKRIQILRIKQG